MQVRHGPEVAELVLRDGTRVIARELVPTDGAALEGFVDDLSEDTACYRFLVGGLGRDFLT